MSAMPGRGQSAPQVRGARVFQEFEFQLIEADGTAEQVKWDAVDYDELGGVDLSNNRITIPADGIYILVTQVIMTDVEDQDELFPAINTDGTAVAGSEMGISTDGVSFTSAGWPVVDIRQLSAGTHVTVEMNLYAETDKNVENGIENSYLAVAPLSLAPTDGGGGGGGLPGWVPVLLAGATTGAGGTIVEQGWNLEQRFGG